MKTELKNSIENFLRELDTEVDVLNYVDIDNIDFENAFDSIRDMVEDNNGLDFEVIYYSNAIDYLSENDPSLNESLGLAHEMGYTAENLDSEILASLLKTENVKIKFYELEDEINDFFEEKIENVRNDFNELENEINDFIESLEEEEEE